MRWACILALILCSSTVVDAATAKIQKVLPHFIDREGRHSLSPSLYERDAYQAQLRQKPEMRAGLRFDVQWKGSRGVPLVLRVELRGNHGGTETTANIHHEVRGRRWFSKWSALTLTGEDYKKFGELVAWRATVWEGDQQLAEQRSFLW
jgi:hypothetical protein